MQTWSKHVLQIHHHSNHHHHSKTSRGSLSGRRASVRVLVSDSAWRPGGLAAARMKRPGPPGTVGSLNDSVIQALTLVTAQCRLPPTWSPSMYCLQLHDRYNFHVGLKTSLLESQSVETGLLVPDTSLCCSVLVAERGRQRSQYGGHTLVSESDKRMMTAQMLARCAVQTVCHHSMARCDMYTVCHQGI